MAMSAKTALNLSKVPMLGPHVMRPLSDAMRPDRLRRRVVPMVGEEKEREPRANASKPFGTGRLVQMLFELYHGSAVPHDPTR
jgi:hypothetical protein